MLRSVRFGQIKYKEDMDGGMLLKVCKAFIHLCIMENSGLLLCLQGNVVSTFIGEPSNERTFPCFHARVYDSTQRRKKRKELYLRTSSHTSNVLFPRF